MFKKFNHIILYFTASIVFSSNIYIAETRKSNDSNLKNLDADSKFKEVPKNLTFDNKVQVSNVIVNKPDLKDDILKYRQNINRLMVKMITPEMIQEWASKFSEKLLLHEEKVVRPKDIMKPFTKVKLEIRNGSNIIDRIARELEDLFIRRATAAENIMRKVEKLAEHKMEPPPKYTFYPSKDLNKIKPIMPTEDALEIPLDCLNLNMVNLAHNKHFDAEVSLETSSVHVATEIFDCDPEVVDALHYSEGLIQTFRNNFAQDSMIDFQYFCSVKGFLRHYPAALWESMEKLKVVSRVKDQVLADVYDCRLRPWYVSASGAPRDILILLDATASMNKSSNLVVAEVFTAALLNALTDDDRVNVFRFNVIVESPINCFNDILVPANHINTAAIMNTMKDYPLRNTTDLGYVLEYAVEFLKKQKGSADRPPSCQQAIVLLTDNVYYNHTELLQQLDPEGKIRMFVMWLHDLNGLRDNTKEMAQTLSCSQDGYFAELITHADVTQQVMEILRVMERPLVAQRKERLKVFSDVYAHIEDPRKVEYRWIQKEDKEQASRYRELRKDKEGLLNDSRMMKDYMHQYSIDEFGHYYEGEDVKYRMMITVSVPVFDHTEVESIRIVLDEEKQRNATRTYPVNRLLGVAGVDIPVDHLKSILPYYEIGPGASLFLVDHRGSMVLHNNLKPTFDGDLLKPGYRTVDFLDLEQPGVDHLARHYPPDWLKFRHLAILEQKKGTKVLYGKNIFDNQMRSFLEQREFHWRRVIDHYTVFVVLPPYARQTAVPESTFTSKLAADALSALDGTDFSVHPDWLYCRHVEPYFHNKTDEVEHFLNRRKEEPDFSMENLKHHFYPIPPTLSQRTYKCDEKLMARFSYDAIATETWAREREEADVRDCKILICPLGSTTAFFATESGLTRWQPYHAASAHGEPPEGYEWPRGPSESWYRRAAASPGKLVIHAPTYPVRRMRITELPPKPIGVRANWFTAARTLNIPGRGNIGVTGFHFHPDHLRDVFELTVNFPCTEDDVDDCEARCDGLSWTCVLIDDAGWILTAGDSEGQENMQGEGVRKHLSIEHPGVMERLLNASVFKLHWIHDYQAMCFTFETPSSAQALASILKTITNSVLLLFQLATNVISAVTFLLNSQTVESDTKVEKDKRLNKINKDYAREKFDRLYDDRVLVNRSKFAACDRSRPVYELQRNPAAMAALTRPAEIRSSCPWPLVAAPVEQTNLVIIAIYTLCPYTEGRKIPNPLINEMVSIDDDDETLAAASKLACWRNRVPLPGRSPSTACFPHNYEQVLLPFKLAFRGRAVMIVPYIKYYRHQYAQLLTFLIHWLGNLRSGAIWWQEERGYRQCGPWEADPEPDESSVNNNLPYNALILALSIFLYYNR